MDIHLNNRAMIGGHAAVRAVSKDGQYEAIFLCAGTGSSAHCFAKAEQNARYAGFKPLPYRREVAPGEWVTQDYYPR